MEQIRASSTGSSATRGVLIGEKKVIFFYSSVSTDVESPIGWHTPMCRENEKLFIALD